MPKHSLTRLLAIFANKKMGPLTQLLIRQFIRYYDVDMSEVATDDLTDFATFNDFFIRKLKPNARPMATPKKALVSPVDAIMNHFGMISDNQIFQAKHHHYTIEQLLGGNQETAALFYNGHSITFYLSPRHYHRFHMPITGILKKMIYVPGKLFSVNQASAKHIPRLFARNERVICIFETSFGMLAMVFVGAMIVGSIHTVWHGDVTPTATQTITHWEYAKPTPFQQGEELGYFKLGSTVILLLSPCSLDWHKQQGPQQEIKLGELIATYQ